MSKPNEERDIYYIPPNFLASGRLFGGMIRARNAIEACVLVLLTGIPIIKLPMSLTVRIIILCLLPLPLGIFGIIGFEGDSLSEFAINWVRWFIHRRNLYRSDVTIPETARKQKKRIWEQEATKPPEELGIRIKQPRKKRKRPAKTEKQLNKNNRKMVPSHKKQVTYSEDFLPVKDIRNGIIEMEDGRYIRVLEVEPINFLLRSTSEQKNIVASFASWMKISPIKIQIKVLTKKADIGKHLSTIERDMESESNPKCRELQLDYYRLTGKSRAISRNLVLQAVKRGESVILTDPKSELYESMGEYLRENGYIVKVFNLVEMDHSDSWNCLGEVGSSELMAQTFADIVLQNTSGDSKDAFWYNAELNLLKALVLYVALEMPPEKRNIATVYDLLYTQTEKGLSDMMASISHEHANQYTGELLPPSPASAPYAIFRQSSETVRTSVIIGLGSKLAVLQAQQVRNITSYNEIDLELPGKQKCAYFCIVSDQDSTYDFLSSLFFSFLFIRLIRYADAYCEGGMLHPKVKFILDEFPNCCLIPDFTKKCSTIRSRGCSVAVFFQNVGQMRNRYPDDQWQEILGACDSTVFLGCTDMLTAEYFSDRIGTASVEVEGTMRELNTMHITDYTPRFRKTNSLGRRPLLTPDEVLRLPPDQVLIFIRGQKVMRAKRFDYSLHPDYKKLKSRKAILHEPDWKSSQASSVSASGVSSPSVTAAIPAEKANVGSQKKPPGKPPRSTTRKVVNADELF